MGGWGARTETDLLLWSVFNYGLSVASVLGNVLLCIVLVSSRSLRRRCSTLFFWSSGFWYLWTGVFFIPFGFQQRITGKGGIPGDAQWLCILGPFLLDMSFNVEVLGILALGAGYWDSIKKGLKDLSWTPGTAWLILALVWLLSAALSLPWSIVRFAVKAPNATDNDILTHTCSRTKEEWFGWFNTIVAFSGSFVFTVLADIIVIVVLVKAFRKTSPLMQKPKADIKGLGLILLKFNLCWLPTWIKFLIAKIKKDTIPKNFAVFSSLLGRYLHDHCCFWNVVILLIIPLYLLAWKQIFGCKCRSPDPDEDSDIMNENKSPRNHYVLAVSERTGYV